jgi:hypothetical protein
MTYQYEGLRIAVDLGSSQGVIPWVYYYRGRYLALGESGIYERTFGLLAIL